MFAIVTAIVMIINLAQPVVVRWDMPPWPLLLVFQAKMKNLLIFKYR